MEEEKEIVITFESLFELLRREKDREALQKLNTTFFEDVVTYINEKMNGLKDDNASSSEKDKIEKQLQNIKKIVKELYERRERKIINLALDKSRTNSSVDTSALLKDEQGFFNFIFNVLNSSREKILNNVVEGKIPEKIEEKKETERMIREAAPDISAKETKLLRFLHAVPRFLGKELEEYGPFEEEDVASLPTEIADVLINKGRAEEITEGY